MNAACFFAFLLLGVTVSGMFLKNEEIQNNFTPNTFKFNLNVSYVVKNLTPYMIVITLVQM